MKIDRSKITSFIKALHELDPDLTEDNMTDIFWLSLQMGSANHSTKAVPATPTETQSNKNNPASDPNAQGALPSSKTPPSDFKPSPPDKVDTEIHQRIPPNIRNNSITDAHANTLPFKSPIVAALPNSLAIGRAIRPFMRRIPSRTDFAIDEIQSAQQIAEQLLAKQRYWAPILHPRSAHWLELALVIDESRSMNIWQQPIFELKNLLERHGAFRDVRTWGLDYDENHQHIRIRAGWPRKNASQLHTPSELIDPSGHRLILIFSDCVSRVWNSSTLADIFTMWGYSVPIALFQVLPQRLWKRTTLGNRTEINIHAKGPAQPNRQLDYAFANDIQEKIKGSAVPLPVVTWQEDILSSWSQAVMTHNKNWISGYLFQEGIGSKTDAADEVIQEKTADEGIQTAQQFIQNFSISASPLARTLLGLLAATPISLPVVRLVQHTLLPSSNLDHIAEIFLSGLIEQLPSNKYDPDPNSIQYDFIPGIRDLLLDTMPLNETLQVQNALSSFIKSNIGQALDINTLLKTPLQIGNFTLNENSKPFAKVASDVLIRLGGEYTILAGHLQEIIHAERSNKKVDTTTSIHIQTDTTRNLSESSWTDINDIKLFLNNVVVGNNIYIRMKDGGTHQGLLSELSLHHLTLQTQMGDSISFGLHEITSYQTTDEELTQSHILPKIITHTQASNHQHNLQPEDASLEEKQDRAIHSEQSLFDIMILHDVALIEDMIADKIASASMTIIAPDFTINAIEIGKAHSEWTRIKQIYELAAKIHELGPPFGQLKPLITDLKELIKHVSPSAELYRYLAYFQFISGDTKEALQVYKDVCLISPITTDWHNLTVIALQNEDTVLLAYYALTQLFKELPITELPDDWFTFVRLIEKVGDALPLREIATTMQRTLSEKEKQYLFQAAIYICLKFDKPQVAQNLIGGSLKEKPYHELLLEASKHFIAKKTNLYRQQCLLWESDIFRNAINFANDGEYVKAVTQMKKVLATTPDYPQAQELYEKWRKFARASNVPRGSTPYLRAKRKQLIEKDLEGAISLFYQAIRQNDNTESAIKDLAVLLMQVQRSDEAIEVLLNNRNRIRGDKQSLDNVLIDAYQKAEKYQPAIDLLERNLRNTSAPNKRAQMYWRIGYCYMHQLNYQSGEHWFRELLKTGLNNQGAQRNLAFCLLQQKRYDEAEQVVRDSVLDSVLDNQSLELLSAIETARSTGHVMVDFNTEMSLADFSSEISGFTRFFLDRCSYEGVPLYRIQEQHIDREDVRRLEELAIRLGTRRPRERAEYYLSAARIIYDHEDWEDEYNQLYSYLCRSFASRGDAAVRDYKSLDTAREWYCEALVVYDGYRKQRTSDEQDATNALIRFLFATFGRTNVPISTRLRIDDSLEQVLAIHEQQEKAFDAIAYLVFHSQFAANRILSRIYANPDFQQKALEYLLHKGIPITDGLLTQLQFSKLWKKLQFKHLERTRTISIELRLVARVELTMASIEESLKRIKAVEQDLFFSLDFLRINELQKILENMLDLCQQLIFEEQERFCTQIDSRCQDLLREIEASPTKFSVENLYPIIDAIKQKVSEYLEGKYIASVPQVTLRLPTDLESYTLPDATNPLIDVQIVIKNELECSPAVNVVLIIVQEEGDLDAFTVEENEHKLAGSLRGGEQRIVRIPIRVTDQVIASQAFSLSMYAEYRTRSKDEAHTQPVIFPINLYSAESFVHIEDPYAPYASGGIVGDETMFYGRAELLDNITDAIHSSWTQSKSMVIFGQKLSGKSSILHHLERKLNSYDDLLVVNLGSLGNIIDAGTNIPSFYLLLWDILSHLQDVIEDEMLAGKPSLSLPLPSEIEFYQHPAPLNLFKTVLHQFKRIIARTEGWQSKRIVLLIDEFSYIYKMIMEKRLSEDFMKTWKALLQENLFSAVLTGQDMMPKFIEQFPNDFGAIQKKWVGYLKPKDAYRLINDPILIQHEGERGSRYREKAIEKIIDLTACSPFYIQIVCNRLVEHMNRRRTPLVTEADVEQVKNELIQGPTCLDWGNFDNLTNSGDTSPDAIPEEDARAVLKAIADVCRTRSSCNRNRISHLELQTDLDKVLIDLEKREVIEAKPGQYYAIRVGLFKEWLLVHK